MNAQTLSVILASAAFKANPELFLSAMAIGVPLPLAEVEPEPEAPKLKKQWSPEAKAKAAATRAAKRRIEPVAEAAPVPEKKPVNAWNLLVEETVADMRKNGWAAFTDNEGQLWPASVAEGERHIFSGGHYAGKEASRYAGGFKLASLRRKGYVPLGRHAHLVAEPLPEPEVVVVEDRPAFLEPEPSASTKTCISCKHVVPLQAFQKAGSKRELKCCLKCREKQKPRTVLANLVHNQKAKEARHALKAAAAGGDPEAIATLAALAAKRLAANAEAREREDQAQLLRWRERAEPVETTAE